MAAPVFLSVVVGAPPMWTALLIASAPWLVYFLLNRCFVRKTPLRRPHHCFCCRDVNRISGFPRQNCEFGGSDYHLGSISIYYGLVNNTDRGRVYWSIMAASFSIIILLLSIWFFSQGEERILPFNEWAFNLAGNLPKISDQVLGLHSLGTLLAVAIPVLLTKGLFSKGGMRWLSLVGCIALAAILFLSTSGAGWGGAFVAVIFVLAAWKRRTLWLKLPPAGIALVLTAVNYANLRWFASVFSTRSLEHRIDTRMKTLTLMKESWFTGVGAGTWSEAFFRRYGENWINAHNSYLQLWADTGVLGIVAAAIAFVIFLRLTWNILKSRKADSWQGIGIGLAGSILAGGLISMFEVIFTGAFETPAYHYLSIPLLWIIAALFVISYNHRVSVPRIS